MPEWPVIKDPYNHQRMCDLEAENERLRGLLRRIEDVTTNEPDAVEAASRASYIAHDGLKRV